MAAFFPVLLLDVHLQPSPHRLEGLGQPAQGAQAEGGFVQQPSLVGFRERGRDATPRGLEEAGDGSQVGTERAEFLRSCSLRSLAGCGRSKPCHTPPAATPPGSRGPRLGRAAGGLRAWAGRLPSWSRRGVRRAAGAPRARPRAAARAVAGRSIRAAADAHRARRAAPAASRFTVSSFAASSAAEVSIPLRLAQPDERFGEPGDGWRLPQGRQAVGVGGPVEQAQQPQQARASCRARALRRSAAASRATSRRRP